MTMTYIAIIAAGLIVVVLVGAVLLRKDTRDEVDLFHRARTMTTSWAEQHGRDEAQAPYPGAETPADAGRRTAEPSVDDITRD